MQLYHIYFYCQQQIYIANPKSVLSTTNLRAVRSIPLMYTSENAGMHTMSLPLIAKYPLAIAIALIVWFTAPAPIACISAASFVRITSANAPATEFGTDFDETFNEVLAQYSEERVINDYINIYSKI